MTLPSHILIVDDDEAGQLALEGLLSLEGYQLTVASNGYEAIETARAILPDLILLDVMMPGMDGFEVCQYLRQDALLAEVPVILVTTLDSQESRMRGLEAGADDFISKPFDRVELRARVSTVTRLNRYRRLLTERQKFEWVVEEAEEGYILLDSHGLICYANAQARLYLELNEATDQHIEQSNQPFLQQVQALYQCQPEHAWETWPEPPVDQPNIPRYLVRAEATDSPIFWLQIGAFRLAGSREEWLIRLRNINDKVLEQQRMWTFERLVSHKLRTPLTGLAALQLVHNRLKKMQVDEDLIGLVEAAQESFERLQHQTADILAYLDAPALLKGEDGCPLYILPSLFSEVANMLGIRYDYADHALINGQLILSYQAIRAVFQELLENARKFHPQKKPQVHLELTELAEQRLRISIRDDGRRLSPAELARVWIPYYQSEKNFTGEILGMGLGLSTVASLVWSVGGNCRMLNRTDNCSGILVELILPFHPPEEFCL